MFMPTFDVGSLSYDTLFPEAQSDLIDAVTYLFHVQYTSPKVFLFMRFY